MSTNGIFWHWPDHNIGKRESRRLRLEHNALANEHAELAAANEKLVAVLKEIAERGPVAGYSSKNSYHLRLVASQSLARGILAEVGATK